MKGQIETVVFFMISLVILLLGLVLLVQVSNYADPLEQVAIINAEKLSSAMNQACLQSSSSSPVPLSLSLPQSVPVSVNLFATDKIPLLPGFALRLRGDPKFLVYYESFPPGEAVGWEIYHSFDARVIGPFKGTDLTTYKSRLNELLLSANGKPVEAVIVNNIILHDSFDPQSGLEAEENIFSIGSYRQGAGYRKGARSQYEYWNFAGLSLINKSLIKYQPCGDNALCLKTEHGIRGYPLTQCAAAGIDYVQVLEFSEPSDPENPYSVTTKHMSDFYLASPCKADVKIFVDNCNDKYGRIVENSKCSDFEKTDLLLYSSGRLLKEGDHYSCISKISPAGQEQPGPERCVRIAITKKEGFCVTESHIGMADNPVPANVEYDSEKDSYVLVRTADIKEPGVLLKFTSGSWMWPSKGTIESILEAFG